MIEEQAEAINAEPEDIRAIVEKLMAWGESLSPAEQVMLGLLLKRLGEGDPLNLAPDAPDDHAPAP